MLPHSSNSVVRWLEEFAGRAGFGTWIAFLALVAGCLASFFTDDIKSAVPFQWPGVNYPWPGRINVLALEFWIVVLTWFVLYWVRQRVESKSIGILQRRAAEISKQVDSVEKNVSQIGADTHSIGIATEIIHVSVEGTKNSAGLLREATAATAAKLEHIDEAVKNVQQNAERLQTTIETMPLGSFLADFGYLIVHSQGLLTKNIREQLRDNVDEKALLNVIRKLMGSVATLAAKYDGRPNAGYGANIMLFVPARKEPPYFAEEIIERLRFFPKKEADLASLRGALVLVKELNSRANAFEGEEDRDDEIEALALGIPQEPFDLETGKWRLFPGPARVFVGAEGGSSSNRLAAEIVDDYGSVGSTDLDSRSQISSAIHDFRNYYGEQGRGRAARSSVSFPLIDWRGEARGVLNIYCDTPPWLGRTGIRQQNFTMLALPLVGDIARLTETLATTEHCPALEELSSEPSGLLF
jgi:hypothetical protein